MTADGTAWYWCLFKYGEVWRGLAGHGEARRGWARRGKDEGPHSAPLFMNEFRRKICEARLG